VGSTGWRCQASTFTAGAAATSIAGFLLVAGGTYNAAASGGLSVGDDVTVSSGTFTAPTGATTFTVGGDWLRSAPGTFTPGTGTVTFDRGAGAQTLVSGGTAVNALSHTGAGTLLIDDFNVTVNSTLTNTAGTINLSTNQLSMTVTGATTR